jgi:glycosyltransferase involved in cell wall biosynthesis
VKITFPVFGLGGAGGEKALVRIANGLVDRGHDVSFVLPLGGYSKTYPTKARLIKTLPIISGYRKLHVPYINLLTSCIALTPRIPKSEIVCANFCLTALPTLIATRLLKKGTPFYFVQHYESLFFDKFYQFGYRSHVKGMYRYFENIITVSKWLDDKIYEHTGKRSTVINPGIDLDIFRPLKNEKTNMKTVLCLGVNPVWKGNADVIEAMEIVYEKCKKVKLIIVGRADIQVKSEIPYEQRRATDQELAKLYSSCNVYVLGSWYEGCPAPPLEAMACGAPVVSTDNLGIREYGVDGRNCLVVPPRNPQAMADAILRLLSDKDLCQRLSEEGLKTAQQFTWDKTVDKIERLFEQTLRKGD